MQTFRALSYVFASRFVRLGGWILLASATVTLLIILSLAYIFSGWWLVLLIPYVLCLLLSVGVYLIARLVLTKLYPHKLTPAQKYSLSAFTDKVMKLLELRGLSPWMIVAIVFKDLVVHHELTTLRQLISDSVSLKKDFAELEENLARDQGALT